MRAAIPSLAILCLAACAPTVMPTMDEPGPAAITSFGFVVPPTMATIHEDSHTISALVPSGTDCSSLIAVFAADGARVSVDGVTQESGVTSNDFSQSVQYVVERSDGSSASYVVTVAVAPPPSREKAITAFSFQRPPVTAAINEQDHTISAVVPKGTDRSALIAVFISTGVRVAVEETEQQSGVTINDFTEPVTYAVTAEDGSTQGYVVSVVEEPGHEKALTGFALLAPGAATAIDEAQHIVRARVAEGTDLSSLVATFTTTGAEVRVAGLRQESGVTANDFRLPVSYEVLAEDGSSTLYTVRVADRIQLVVNELDVDQVGTDNAEFIELYAAAEVDLWGIAVVLLNGGVTPGLEYGRVDLGSQGILPSGSYLVIAGPSVSVSAPALKYTPPGWELTNRIQNGPSDAVMIWDSLGRRPVDSVTYSGVLHRALLAGETEEVDATEGGAGAPADSNSAVGAIARSPNAQDTNQNGADFRFSAAATPGAPNP